MKRILIALGCLSLLPSALHAQAKPAATRGGIVQVGVGYTTANTDYIQQRIAGITGFASLDFTRHLGVNAEYHYVSIHTPGDFGQNSLEGGLRYVILRRGRFAPYGKAEIGIATADFQTPYNPHKASYLEYGLGGGVDVRVAERYSVRADYEVQIWPTFPPNNLTPALLTIGVAYRVR